VVRADRQSVLGLHHRHRGLPAQELDQQALVLGIEMLDQDEGHAALRRHDRKERLEGFEPAGGRAETHDQAGHVRGVSRTGRGFRHAKTGRCSFSPRRPMAIGAAIPVLLPSRHLD